jgi:DNA/RNA-binding domain of Phe-tRNA-synthetase-like protein
MSLKIDSELKTRFPDLAVRIFQIKEVKIQKRNSELEKFKVEVIRQVREEYDLESLKDQPIFRAYRDFFWKVGIDPTKNRPAAEALIRRILGGRNVPNINSLVDAYNLASINSRIALATFDADKLEGELLMRFAEEKEQFLGIGMEKPLILEGGEIVVSDNEKLIAVYPYRDADNTKVTEKTESVTIIVCGAPAINEETLENASQLAQKYIQRFCDGNVKQLF